MNTRNLRTPLMTATVMALFGLAGNAVAQIETSAVNVKHLKAFDPKQGASAAGDGKTDDTAAIQAAADLAKLHTRTLKPEGGSYLGSSTALYFPAGHYVISDEINLGPYTNIVSDSRAIIEQKNPEKRAFVFNNAYTISVRGLRFIGGKHQIWIENKNTDSTMLTITECEFQVSADYAIFTQGTASPSDVHMSANLVINNCKFIRPRKVLRNVCDYCSVRDTWVTIGHDNFDSDSAAFLNTSGTLMLDNLIGVPVFGSIDAQGRQTLDAGGIDRVRWIDNHGNVLAQKCRFGGEFGGIPIIHHFSLPNSKYPKMGKTVLIENSWICAGPKARKDSAVITFREGIPQLLRIVGNSNLVDGTMILNEAPSLATFLKGNPDLKERIQFEIHSNMTWPNEVAIPSEFNGFLGEKSKPARR